MTVVDTERRRQLADFLRTCRERLQPEDVGIPDRKTRRRAKGLRREEVATLAGVSVTWYTWIEQGRDISVSSEVLTRIADALGLDAAQRAYLFSLTAADGRVLETNDGEQVVTALQEVLDCFGVNPAFLLGRGWTSSRPTLPRGPSSLMKRRYLLGSGPRLADVLQPFDTGIHRRLGGQRKGHHFAAPVELGASSGGFQIRGVDLRSHTRQSRVPAMVATARRVRPATRSQGSQSPACWPAIVSTKRLSGRRTLGPHAGAQHTLAGH